MLFSFVSFSSAASYAACSSPAGIEGKIIYNTTHKTAQFCDGTDWWSMKSGGAASGGGGPTGIQVFNTSGTWTKPAGVTKVIIKVQGGGGGGGGSVPSESGSGGGGGGYCEKFIDVTAIASETVTVGGGGAGGIGGPFVGGSGANGGTSSFGAHCTGNSGTKGLYSTISDLGGAGGTATGGNINIPGIRGSRSEVDSNDMFPDGGDAFMGSGSRAAKNGFDPDDAGNYGGGGAGGFNQSPGANGGDGVVIVWEY